MNFTEKCFYLLILSAVASNSYTFEAQVLFGPTDICVRHRFVINADATVGDVRRMLGFPHSVEFWGDQKYSDQTAMASIVKSEETKTKRKCNWIMINIEPRQRPSQLQEIHRILLSCCKKDKLCTKQDHVHCLR